MERGGDIAHEYLKKIEIKFGKRPRLGTFDVTGSDHFIAPDQRNSQG